jgi:predicted nucleotidyltransferase
MGVVFTPTQVYDGQVPTMSAFAQMIESVRDRVREDEAFVAVLVLGSIIRGDGNRRSDLDIAVVFREGMRVHAWRAMDELVYEAKTTFVPLRFDRYDHLIAGTGLHFAGPSYVTHLRLSAGRGGNLKGNLVEHFVPNVPAPEDIKAYLRHKIHALENASGGHYELDEELQVRYLEKVLEAPVHAARKFLAYKGLLEDDSKESVVTRFAEEVDAELAATLKCLIDLDRWYTSELEDHLCDFDEFAYRRTLHTIYDNAPEVVRFVTRVARLLEA